MKIVLFALLFWSFHARAATLPSDPFERLLHRLDHAPIDLSAAAQSSAKGTKMQQAAASFAKTTAPLSPALDRVAKSRALALMGRVPMAGKPIQMTQSAAKTIAALNRGFARLVELDKKRVQPLRDASTAAAGLQKSRRRDHLPGAVKKFKAAHGVLQSDEAFLRGQRQRLSQVSSLLKSLAPYIQKYGGATGGKPPSIQKAQQGLSALGKTLDTQIAQLAVLRGFTGACADDGQKVLDEK